MELFFVMVWIYGGYYEVLLGLVYDGRILVLWGEVIVVIVNYRFGVFGI